MVASKIWSMKRVRCEEKKYGAIATTVMTKMTTLVSEWIHCIGGDLVVKRSKVFLFLGTIYLGQIVLRFGGNRRMSPTKKF